MDETIKKDWCPGCLGFGHQQGCTTCDGEGIIITNPKPSKRDNDDTMDGSARGNRGDEEARVEG